VLHASWDDHILQPRENMQASREAGLDRAIVAAQRRNAGRKFDDRRALMRFDDIVEQQRATILVQRDIIRDTADPLGLVRDLRDDTIDDLLQRFANGRQAPDLINLDLQVRAILTLAIEFPPAIADDVQQARLRRRLVSAADKWMAGKIAAFGEARLAEALRTLMLALLDQLWCEQTARLDHLRRRIADRRVSTHLVHAEFGAEAFEMLACSLREFSHEVTAHAMRIGLRCSP
jgi:preprotein translocase subunit SecA